jgi:uncharacterized protein
MFGVGLGFLMRSTARRGLPFGRVYRNRMIGLAILGIVHGCLFFPGDILTIYAVTGSILYLFRDWPVRRLVRVGAALLVVQALIAPLLLLATPETPPDIVAMERAILIEGGFPEAVLFRSIGFAFIMPSFLVIQGTAALGWFCLGLAAVKSGMIDDAMHPLWRRARRWCLGPGVALGLLGAAIWQWGPPVPGVVLTVVSAPVATLGYLGLIAAVSRPPGPIMAQALKAGGSSLSIYLGQSIILSTIFSGYGLGLWSAVDRLTAVHRARRDGRAMGAAAHLAAIFRARTLRMGPATDHVSRASRLRLQSIGRYHGIGVNIAKAEKRRMFMIPFRFSPAQYGGRYRV